MPYTPVGWQDGATPENEETLGQMDQGIVDAHAGLPPAPSGQDGKWLTVSGGAMIWQPLPPISSIDYEGLWSGTTAYLPGDIVNLNGVEYLAVNPSTGQTPPVYAGLPPLSYGTTLPASPVNGQEAILVDSVTNPSYQWRFRYNAGSSSAYKWEFVGGAPRWATVDASVSISSGTFVLGGGPQIQLSRPGDYIVDAAAIIMVENNALTHGIYSYNIGAVPASDTWGVQFVSTVSLHRAEGFRRYRHNGVVADALVVGAYRSGTGVLSYSQRELSVLPVRVS